MLGIHLLQCLNGCTTDIWSAVDFQPEVDEVRCRLLNEPPRCPLCGGLARPNILMFGDWDWRGHRYQEQHARLQQWLNAVKRLVIIEIGAGTAIPSVRHFGEFQDGFLIRINLRESDLPTGRRGIGLELGGLPGLTRIKDALATMSGG